MSGRDVNLGNQIICSTRGRDVLVAGQFSPEVERRHVRITLGFPDFPANISSDLLVYISTDILVYISTEFWDTFPRIFWSTFLQIFNIYISIDFPTGISPLPRIAGYAENDSCLESSASESVDSDFVNNYTCRCIQTFNLTHCVFILNRYADIYVWIKMEIEMLWNIKRNDHTRYSWVKYTIIWIL